MAKIGTVALTVKAAGDGETLMDSPAFGSNAASPGVVEIVALSSGDNTVAIPTGTRRVTISPPVAGTVALAIGTAGAVPISPAEASLISLPTSSPPANIVINAASAVSVRVSFT